MIRTTPLKRFIYCLVLLSMGCTTSLDAQYHIREVSLPENLQSHAIYCQLQTSNGLMLFGTSEGLYQYDGWRFDHIPGDSVLSREITAVFEDNDGTIWVGTLTGAIGRVRSGQAAGIEPWDIEEGHPHARINSILRDKSGILWIATYGEGIYAWTGNRLYNYNQDDGLPAEEIYQMVQGPQEGVWVGTDLGLIHCSFSSNHKWVRTLTTGLGLPDHIIPAVQVLKDRVWFGTFDRGFGWLDATTQQIKHATPTWSGGSIASMLFFTPDYGFIGTADGGLWEMNGERITPVQFSPKLSGKVSINQLWLDKEGVVWMIVNEQYIYNFLPAMQRWEHSLGDVQSMAYLDLDSIYFGKVDGLAIGRISEAGNLQVIREALSGSNVISLYTDKERFLYAGTFGQGVYVLDPKFRLVAHWDESTGFLNGSILSITRQGNYLWFATLAGVTRVNVKSGNLKEPEIKNFTKAQGLPSNYIYQVRTDHRGRLWIATDGAGVSVLENDHFIHYPTAILRGPNGNDTLSIGNVYSMAEDDQGFLWLNTASNGIIGLDIMAPEGERIDKKVGTNENEISILSWSGAHIVMVDRDGVEAFHPSSNSITYFEESAGIKDLVMNINASWNDGRRGVWFVSNQSLFHYQETPAIWFQPMPVIKEIQVIDGGANLVHSNRFGYEQNHLRISYAGIWFTEPENILFSYRLLGSDSTWRRTRDHQAFFLNLDPGDYEFQVKASVHGDFTSSSRASYNFVVGKPYWMTWWFITLMTILVFALLLGVIKWREYVINQRSAMEKHQIEAELATIKNQINPHFLFNSFNTLAAAIEENQELAIEYVEHLSDFYRKILLFGDSQKIALVEELKIVEEFCSILQYRYGDQLIIDKQPMSQDGQIVPMSLQRLIENAIKHNEISRQKPLTITLFRKDDYVGVSNPVQRKWTTETSTGFGLESIRKQYRFLTAKPVHIHQFENRFTVEIPILTKE
ncbi:MAG: histidine kinase [Lewinellaceae bacterium]|nr:histidine kinase [Lewinellaceae bacterium]HPQ99945.1 two-component regulator propeller domain-containing protein [Saprospiraceae bacterium]